MRLHVSLSSMGLNPLPAPVRKGPLHRWPGHHLLKLDAVTKAALTPHLRHYHLQVAAGSCVRALSQARQYTCAWAPPPHAQAMDLISVAQQTGEVSADAFAAAYDAAGGSLPPPHMVGVEDLVQRMHASDAELNPFSGGGSGGGAAAGGVDNGVGTTGSYGQGVPPSPGNAGGQFRPPAIIPPAPSPPRSVVRSFHVKARGVPEQCIVFCLPLCACSAGMSRVARA